MDAAFLGKVALSPAVHFKRASKGFGGQWGVFHVAQ
jgi:hypothetical protein